MITFIMHVFWSKLNNHRLGFTFAGVPVVSSAFMKWIATLLKYQVFRIAVRRVSTPQDLVELHFRFWSDVNHPVKENFITILNSISLGGCILETGSAAWGTQSTRLFDSFVKKFGGSFVSVDIRREPKSYLKFQISGRTSMIIGDSVEYLTFPQPEVFGKLDFVYLDSMDVDSNHPWECANHAMLELGAVLPHLREGAIVLIDDTPKFDEEEVENLKGESAEFLMSTGELPGKGSLICSEIKRGRVENLQILFHNSQLALVYSFPDKAHH